MKELLCAVLLCVLLPGIICPPVNPQPKEGGTEDEAADTGLEYDHYLQEVVSILEKDVEFKKKLESANITDIKSGGIAQHLELVHHSIRKQLDEVKRREIERLRELARQKMMVIKGMPLVNTVLQMAEAGGMMHPPNKPHHVDTKNLHSFEIEDLKKLILKTTNDLDELDKKRREEFHNYELEKEHERRDHLKGLDQDQRKLEEIKYEEMQKKHKDHPQMHHPGSEAQLKEVWEKDDGLDPEDFNPKTFFQLHDINGDSFLDPDEINAIFIKELDKVYDADNSEDDMIERNEEMERMREHVFTEVDLDKDKLITWDEFLKYTQRPDFEKDEGWLGVDSEPEFTEEEYAEYERMLREEEENMLRSSQGHGQQLNMHQQQDPNMVHQMNMQQQQQYQQGIPQQHQGMPQQQQGMPQQQQGIPQQQQGMPQHQQQGIPQQQQGIPQQQQGIPQQHQAIPQQVIPQQPQAVPQQQQAVPQQQKAVPQQQQAVPQQPQAVPQQPQAVPQQQQAVPQKAQEIPPKVVPQA